MKGGKEAEKQKKKPRESSWKIQYDHTYPKLKGDIEADVLIIGGGLTGIWNAYILAKAGFKPVVLEKRPQILENTTFFTTAFITQIIDTAFSELVSMFGEEKGKLVWQSGQDAIELIARTIKEENIDCEWKSTPFFIYAKNKKEFIELEKERKIIKAHGFQASLHPEADNLGFKNAGYLEIPGQAMFHPTKFGHALAKLAVAAGAKIYTESKVLALDGLTAKTESGQVRAKDMLIATYRPLINKGTHFKKALYDSYVYELQIPRGRIPEGMYADMHNPYHYFRIDAHGTEEDRMIVGGEDHRRDIKIAPEKNFKALEEYVKDVLPGVAYKITYKWSSGVLEPVDGLPLIGAILPHIYVATAFSGNGMTYAPISALIIRDLLKHAKNPYIELYNPLRIASLKQLLYKGRDYIREFFGGIVKNILK